jgi:hypothetical protein
MASAIRRLRPDSPVNRWGDETAVDAPLHPIDLDQNGDRLSRRPPSLGKRSSRALLRFLTTFCIGAGATLAWQSYGDAARQMIASSSPQLGWLAPQAAPLAQVAADAGAPAEPAAPSPDAEQLKAMSVDLAAVRQGVDQLAAALVAGRQQTAGDLATLQASQQAILRKISPPAPRPAPAPVHSAAPPPSLSLSSEAPPLR